jgi:hypothetical protein
MPELNEEPHLVEGATMTEPAPDRPDTSDMLAVHNVFRSSFASGPEFISSAEGDDARRALVANYYVNVMALLDVHHDGEEKFLFPLLTERAPEHRTLVEEAASQHDEAIGRMDAVTSRLGSWETRGDSEGQALVLSLRALDDVLSPHFDQEEAQILPLAGEHLTVEEWGMLPAHGMANFKGDKIWLILGLILENSTQEQRDAMLNGMPQPAREMWENMGEASFNDLIAQLRRMT